MAGTYGYLAKNQANSTNLFQMHWQANLQAKNNKFYLATGFSCRTQALRQINYQLKHPIEIIANLI